MIGGLGWAKNRLAAAGNEDIHGDALDQAVDHSLIRETHNQSYAWCYSAKHLKLLVEPIKDPAIEQGAVILVLKADAMSGIAARFNCHAAQLLRNFPEHHVSKLRPGSDARNDASAEEPIAIGG